MYYTYGHGCEQGQKAKVWVRVKASLSFFTVTSFILIYTNKLTVIQWRRKHFASGGGHNAEIFFDVPPTFLLCPSHEGAQRLFVTD